VTRMFDLDEVALRRCEKAKDVVGQRHVRGAASMGWPDFARYALLGHVVGSSMGLSQAVPVQRQRGDAALPVDLFGDHERGVEFTDAMLLHQLVSSGFFFRFGLC